MYCFALIETVYTYSLWSQIIYFTSCNKVHLIALLSGFFLWSNLEYSYVIPINCGDHGYFYSIIIVFLRVFLYQVSYIKLKLWLHYMNNNWFTKSITNNLLFIKSGYNTFTSVSCLFLLALWRSLWEIDTFKTQTSNPPWSSLQRGIFHIQSLKYREIPIRLDNAINLAVIDWGSSIGRERRCFVTNWIILKPSF